jgi:NitT/TauT family transport system substrate-binding protein
VTLTAVMTDQVDVGWASPPFGLKEQEAGQIRVVAKATDAALVRGQTIRVIVANAQALEKRKDAIDRFMQAYRETIDYMYSDNPQVLKDYAAFVQVSEPMAKRVRDEFFPKSLVDPDAIKGVDSVMKEAVNLKFISEPLTQKQLDELIQIPPRKM